MIGLPRLFRLVVITVFSSLVIHFSQFLREKLAFQIAKLVNLLEITAFNRNKFYELL